MFDSWIRLFSKPGELDGLEAAIDYRFKDKTLLENALVHPSYRFEHSAVNADNQRLEFLGDAVLGLLAADHLFRTCGEIDEGSLTVLRAQVASGNTLAAIGAEIGLDRYLRLGKGEARTGGRRRPKNLEDALEALFGAAWVDGGLRAATRIFDHLVLPRLRAADLKSCDGDGIWNGNPKGHLQSVVQSRFHASVLYTLVSTCGSAHAPVFTVEAKIDMDDGPSATAEGTSKRRAEAKAASKLLGILAAQPD